MMTVTKRETQPRKTFLFSFLFLLLLLSFFFLSSIFASSSSSSSSFSLKKNKTTIGGCTDLQVALDEL